MTDNPLADRTLLMTADTVGGVWTYALELTEALGAFGINVHLATMGKLPSPSQQKQAAGISNLCLHESEYKLEWMEQPWQEVKEAGEWLQELERKLEPDLIHLNNYCHGQLPWKAPLLMTGHSCVPSWWQAVKGEAAPEQYQKYFKEVKEGLQSADVVVAPTQSYLNELKNLYGPLPESRVIPNSRKSSLYKAAVKEEYILSMGRLWDEAKNIKALAAIAGELPWKVKLAGDATHPVNGSTSGFEGLDLCGFLSPEEAAEQLSKASVYVMPAKYEPFGLSVLEAALSGCALVLGDIPSLRENWEGAALFANPEDPEDLKEKIQYLINHPDFRTQLAKKAEKKAAAFTPESQAQAYVDLYDELLKK